MNTISDLYPASPANIPDSLTKPKASYKKQAMLAMMGLIAFIVIYLALMIGFGFITYKNFAAMAVTGDFEFGKLFAGFCAGLLTLFMFKSLFAIRKAGTPNGIEVSEADQPELYAYLHKLADEIGAPRPHRVFLTPQVNAAVFYDLSLINLIIPSKKNLIVGLGLVNVLNLSEFKAVLAHEFGHFSQNTMMVGRWVYIAHQIIAHMVSVRDWFDGIIRFISTIDIRIAWIGWILQLILWSLRSLMEVLFRVVIIAERALSREMEFNADLVAVSVTGSDELVNALYKLQTADQAWQTALSVADRAAGDKKILTDLFDAQTQALEELRRVFDDPSYGTPPQAGGNAKDHRVFEEQSARPPQMWSTHPPSSDREANAKDVYVPAARDERSAWLVFRDAATIREKMSRGLYNAEAIKDFDAATSSEFVAKQFSNISYSPEFRGAYLGRSPVRDFESVDQMMSLATVGGNIDLAALYPESIKSDIKAVNGFNQEVVTLEALLSGDMQPSGGVYRHRGEDIRREEIPDAIEEVKDDKKIALKKLMINEANCRKTSLNIAEKFQNGWPEYLAYSTHLLHCADHLLATVANEHARMINTWQVITADDKIGFFEKRRMVKVCQEADEIITNASQFSEAIKLSKNMCKEIGIESWAAAAPVFDFQPVNKKNFAHWFQEAHEVISHIQHALNVLHNEVLEDLLEKETMLKKHFDAGTAPEAAPKAGFVPPGYPVLLEGDEYVLQKKLDLWNRFQLAHGLVPSLLRTLVSLGVVGGTIFAGLAAF